ncbi:blue-light-activated protein [mine drainage metagenome]|uniref:Blue-light-activated protein n=1 Tax=mine drainage metagenome TaxID=410659 RepID=A0A1J5RT77_9ZZZZ
MLDQSAQRGADLVQQLLTFGRGLDGRRVELQPRMLFHEVRRIIRETFPKNIVLETRIPEDLWTVSADPTQIHQVLLNLCLNARDAMAAGGTLSLAAENVVFDEHYAAMNPEAEAGPYVILEVVDTGVGIPADNLEKIFDPFFTTKEPGVGTGLGLSTVHGIVKGHGGFVQVRSQVGEGTLFKVYLPAIPAVVEVSEIPPGEEIPTGSGETILVVDDEEAVRETLRDMLENHGYRVILAPDGRQGLVCYQQQRQLVRALVTDVMMPVMDGAELVRAIRREDPDLPVIAMSGLPEKELAAGEEGARADAFIMKPFVSEQLLVELHSVLAPGAPPGKELNPSARP